MRKAVSQIFGGNLLSKVLGLGREVLLAALFGTGQAIGAYRIAQTGTLVPVNFFTSDSLNAAFIPLYKRFLRQSKDKAQSLLWTLMGLFAGLSVLIAAGLWLLAPTWIYFLAPGLDPGVKNLAAEMLRIMGAGVPFYLLSNLLIFLGVANGDFVPMAVRPSMQNGGLIAGAVAAFLLRDPAYFAWGFTLGYLVFGIWVLQRAWRLGALAFPTGHEWPLISEVLQAFWGVLRPLILLPLILQGNIALERMIASLLGLVVVSALDYARFLTDTVVFLVSMPVALAGLASWSGLGEAEIKVQMKQVLLLMLLVAVPVSAFLVTHAHLVVMALYGRGAFNSQSVQATGDILFGISLGLWAQVVGYVLIRALNAQLRNRSVLLLMVLALSANALINIAFYQVLGPVTLGVGNTVYGLVLLIGTLTTLGLWRELAAGSWMIVLGVAGYLLANFFLPLPENTWSSLALAGTFALLYWSVWIGGVPSLRHAVFKAVGLRQEQPI